MTYEELRLEFSRRSFRETLKDKLGDKCVNCNSDELIEYHHIVPLRNGGTNNLSNLTPLCSNCHLKAHDRSGFKNKNGGRPKAIEFKDAESILHRYFNIEIGAKEARQLLGLSAKNKSTWSNLTKLYREKHNIEKFYNNIDLLNSQNKRIKNKNVVKGDF